MKKLSECTDREIALLMGALHNGAPGKRSELIAEAAYRLVRSGGGKLARDESSLIDEIHTYDYRLREAERSQRRIRQRRRSGTIKGKVISIAR